MGKRDACGDFAAGSGFVCREDGFLLCGPFVNFTYDLTKFMHTGVEFTSWKTIWLHAPVGNSQRLEWIVRYMF